MNRRELNESAGESVGAFIIAAMCIGAAMLLAGAFDHEVIDAEVLQQEQDAKQNDPGCPSPIAVDRRSFVGTTYRMHDCARDVDFYIFVPGEERPL